MEDRFHASSCWRAKNVWFKIKINRKGNAHLLCPLWYLHPSFGKLPPGSPYYYSQCVSLAFASFISQNLYQLWNASHRLTNTAPTSCSAPLLWGKGLVFDDQVGLSLSKQRRRLTWESLRSVFTSFFRASNWTCNLRKLQVRRWS